MNMQTIDTTLIKPNPWQPRLTMDPASILELANDIKANGLMQPPTARSVNSHYELAFGHRRYEAWKIANPGEPMPLNIADLDDKQMAMQAAAENGQRADLNQIERAKSIERLMEEFDLNQVAAGKLYGLNTQGAVSNLVRLLDLPDKVQKMLIAGQIAERQARALLAVSEFNIDEAVRLAELLVKEDDIVRRDDILRNWIDRFFDKHGKSVNDAPWKGDYPSKPIPLSDVQIKQYKCHNTHFVRKCPGCPSHHKSTYREHCMYAPCYAAKLAVWRDDHILEVAKDLGIKIAGDDEQVTVIYNGDHDVDMNQLQEWLKAKPMHLRLVPYPDSKGNCWGRSANLGSKWVALATTDGKLVAELQKKKAKSEQNTNHKQIDYTEQIRRQKVAREHIERMIKKAATVIAEGLPANEGLIDIMFGLLDVGALNFENEKAYQAANLKAKRLIVAEGILDQQYDREPDKAAADIEAIAKKLKVKPPTRDFWKSLVDVTAEAETEPKQPGGEERQVSND
jgi:ParB/RepB/Spo0J family partition protein